MMIICFVLLAFVCVTSGVGISTICHFYLRPAVADFITVILCVVIVGSFGGMFSKLMLLAGIL